MEREELLQQVQASLTEQGRTLSPSLSEDSINGELDDALLDLGDDEEQNQKVITRLANRLLRMDGNIHSNVSSEVKKYKAKLKKTQGGGGQDGGGTGDDDHNDDDDETPKWAKGLISRIEAIEGSQQQRDKQEAKNAIARSVETGLKSRFKSAGVEVNGYILGQTLRDLEIPETEDGEEVNINRLIGEMERKYYKALKEAGLDKRDTGRSHTGRTGGGRQGETPADRFWDRKGKREGWKQK